MCVGRSALTRPPPEQFADPQLRKFNLIVMETRGHGDTSGKVGKTFSRVEAADDVKKFMVRAPIIAPRSNMLIVTV